MMAWTAFISASYSMRGSYLRLTGQRPNAGECAAAGVEYYEPKIRTDYR